MTLAPYVTPTGEFYPDLQQIPTITIDSFATAGGESGLITLGPGATALRPLRTYTLSGC